MKASHFGIILMALSSLMAVAVNASDIEAGKAKSAVCAGCHGVDGNSSNAVWPSLAGQHAAYLAKQLREFKSGTRATVSLGSRTRAESLSCWPPPAPSGSPPVAQNPLVPHLG